MSPPVFPLSNLDIAPLSVYYFTLCPLPFYNPPILIIIAQSIISFYKMEGWIEKRQLLPNSLNTRWPKAETRAILGRIWLLLNGRDSDVVPRFLFNAINVVISIVL